MEAVVEPTACSTSSGTTVRSEASGMALLGRPRHPLPDIVLYSQKSTVKYFEKLKMYVL